MNIKANIEDIIKAMKGDNEPKNFEFDSNIIFKYGKYDTLEKTLKSSSLNFSSPKSYNDPFETAFILNYSHYPHPELPFATQPQIDRTFALKDTLSKELYNYRICCFSKTGSEPLLWAHYADKHNGICLCFKNSIWELPRKKNILKLCDVIYSTELPILDFCIDSTSPDLLNHAMQRIIATKSHHWAYEKEVRFFYNKINDFKPFFNPSDLFAVIFGVNLWENDKKKTNEAISLIKQYNKENETNVKMFFSVLSDNNYLLESYENDKESTYATTSFVHNNIPLSSSENIDFHSPGQVGSYDY